MNPCLNEGVCMMNDNNSYVCLCPDGLSGKHCEKGGYVHFIFVDQ